MVDPDSFFMDCYRVQYQRDARIGDTFGSPMNCYGFVYWFYKLCLGMELERDGVESFDNIHCVTYNKVDKPQDGDVIWLRTVTGADCIHVGVCWKNVIHHFTATGLREIRLARATSAIKGIYRVTENTQRDIQAG